MITQENVEFGLEDYAKARAVVRGVDWTPQRLKGNFPPREWLTRAIGIGIASDEAARRDSRYYPHLGLVRMGCHMLTGFCGVMSVIQPEHNLMWAEAAGLSAALDFSIGMRMTIQAAQTLETGAGRAVVAREMRSNPLAYDPGVL